MKIIDLYGKEIEIENLQLALLQADDYRHYAHLDATYAKQDHLLQAYWEDVYQKLLALPNGQ